MSERTMNTGILDINTFRLLRIPFSIFLMPVFLLSLSQVPAVNLYTASWTFVILHLLVYPASNGYNSYIDRDETSIGGLEKPPLPTIRLFYVTLVLDILAILLGCLTISFAFAGCLLAYILASRAYSCRQIRLKKYPTLGFLVVIIFQGGFTYYLSWLGISGKPLLLTTSNWFILMAATLQIAGAYPLTQVYQHKEDIANGDVTLSYTLGRNGTFVFTAIMFSTAMFFYYLYFKHTIELSHFFYLLVFLLPVVIYFLNWFYQVKQDPANANYRNAMRMTIIASLCSSACFLFFIFLKYAS